MRKLWLLLIGLLVFTAAAQAQERTISASSATMSFIAFAEFPAAGTFGVRLVFANLTQMPDGYPSDSSSIHWSNNINPSVGTNLGTAGVDKYVNSQVYAILNNQLAPGMRVIAYTNNATSSYTYKHGAGADKDTLDPLAEWSAATGGTNSNGVPLAYTIMSSATLWTATDRSTAPASYIRRIGDINISNTAAYGTNFVMDKARNDYAPSNVANIDGYFAGYGAGPGEEHFANDGTPYYMFFSSNFVSARRGFRYITDTFTFEIINE